MLRRRTFLELFLWSLSTQRTAKISWISKIQEWSNSYLGLSAAVPKASRVINTNGNSKERLNHLIFTGRISEPQQERESVDQCGPLCWRPFLFLFVWVSSPPSNQPKWPILKKKWKMANHSKSKGLRFPFRWCAHLVSLWSTTLSNWSLGSSHSQKIMKLWQKWMYQSPSSWQLPDS